MRKTASRMHVCCSTIHIDRRLILLHQVMCISDLDPHESLHASMRMRLDARKPIASQDIVKRAIGVVGGRLSYLSKISKAREMEEQAQHMLDVEKGWLLSQIGLIPDCDDDVMDEVSICMTKYNVTYSLTIVC
jgi:hypothetical protein